MKRAFLSFCIVFVVMWLGFFAEHMYAPVKNYFSKNPHIVLQISQLGRDLAENESNRLKAESDKLQYKMAEDCHFELLMKGQFASDTCIWIVNDYLRNLPDRMKEKLNPFGRSVDLLAPLMGKTEEFSQVCRKAEEERKRVINLHKECCERIGHLEAEKAELESKHREAEMGLKNLQRQIRVAGMEYLVQGWCIPLQVSLLLSAYVLLHRVLAYFVYVPLLGRYLHGVQLPASVVPQDADDSSGGRKIIHCELSPGDSLILKNERYCGGYSDAAAGDQLQKRTRFIYSTRYWLMSLMCGLTIMTRFLNKSKEVQHIRITSDDPDEYFCKFRLEEGAQIFVTPGDLVAFSGGVRLAVLNRLSSYSAWAMGQVRYYTLVGSGEVVLRAHGGMTRIVSGGGRYNVHKKHSIIDAGGHLKLVPHRTETFIPYLLGNSSLYDVRIEGEGEYHIRNTAKKALTVSERLSNVFFSSLGKFLGF